ncbi:uncharacterized protein LOC115080763 isoform X2 [Rhinatrema bivittatum]|uniref:uncharacterized protein LOC115080763 isoform X2 n=1 Tax=Rhinatrema bivittatum TaxID=194408 RepID=UPI00112D6373|nr:uncharacterized protein LOC115080763 isoform X2 [Rhinatrema bivittatum]
MLSHKSYILGDDLPPPITGSRLASLPCLSTKITNDISRKFLERSDLSKLQHFHPAQFEDRTQILNELDSLFVSDPGAKVKLVFMENRMLVKNIFIMTSAMQDMVQRFPEYLYVDLLPHFGSHVDLYTVYCEDDNAEWKVCAKCLARKGQSEHLRFLVVSICQSIQNLTDQVKYVTVNPEIWEPLDLKPLVPFASLRYCMPQVLEILYERISDADSTAEAQIKNFLHILAHSCSPVFYNQYLNELKAACPAEFFQYYYETWHPHREMWIIKDSRSQIAESNICAFIKSKHQALRVNVDAASSLYCCLHLALNDSTTVLNTTSASNLQESPSMPDTSLALALHQKTVVLASSFDKEETEESSTERCEDLDISKRQVGGAPGEERLERNEFHSWEDFCSFLDDWCEERKLTFAILQSMALSEEDRSRAPWGPDAAKSLKYKLVRMGCTVFTKKKKCPAVIKLKLGPQKDKLIVTKAILHHNHDLPETALPPEVKRCRLMAPTDLPTRIANDISRKFLECNDLKRLQRFHSDAFEDRTQVLAELGSLFISDPGAKVKLVFVEDKGLVKNIFLMTSHMQDLAHQFAGHLYVDLLADFSPGFALYTIFCEEEGNGWKVCAYCLARKDESDSLRFLMVSVLQSIPKLNTSVKHLTVSPEFEDPLDIEALMPYASVRYCMPLVLELLYSKLSHLDSIVQAQIKKHLLDLAHSLSPEIYSNTLRDLIAVCPADIFRYYSDTWHPRKKLWVRQQGENQGAEDSICAFMKAKHLALKGRMGTSSSLHHCLQVVLSDSRTALEERETFLAQETAAAIDIAPTGSQQKEELPVGAPCPADIFFPPPFSAVIKQKAASVPMGGMNAAEDASAAVTDVPLSTNMKSEEVSLPISVTSPAQNASAAFMHAPISGDVKSERQDSMACRSGFTAEEIVKDLQNLSKDVSECDESTESNDECYGPASSSDSDSCVDNATANAETLPRSQEQRETLPRRKTHSRSPHQSYEGCGRQLESNEDYPSEESNEDPIDQPAPPAQLPSAPLHVPASCRRGTAVALSSMTPGEKLVSPDGTEWEVVGSSNAAAGQQAQQNVLGEEPGPTPRATCSISDGSVASSWFLIIDDFILGKIKICTEIEAHRQGEKDDWSVSSSELRAFIAILYVRGATRAKDLKLETLWSDEWGIPFCKNAMSRNRFNEIMKYLRFSEKSTRSARLGVDKFALFSEVWNRFTRNIQMCYTAGPHVTIDEQLFPTKTRCRFLQFMASKPDKYGQKFWFAVDNDSKYLLNAFPYLGKDDQKADDQHLADYVVMKLIEPLANKGRIVTCDNFFTSLSLAEKLKKMHTSLVGIVNRARREVPIEVKNSREALYTTQVLKKGDTTMTVYQRKANKNVILLSTMHPDVQLGPDTKRKPNTVTFYNETKSGVDVIDQMARKYSVKAASRRWPVHTFYNMLDLAAINAWILYKTVTNVKVSRRDFILKLGKELAEENITSRNRAMASAEDFTDLSAAASSLRSCQVKKACNKARSPNQCSICKKAVCKKCIGKKSFICADCANEQNLKAVSVPVREAENASMTIMDAPMSTGLKSEMQESCSDGSLLSMETCLPSLTSLPTTSIEHIKHKDHTALMEEQVAQNRFQSWEDLCIFLDSWCEEKNMQFAIHGSEALNEEDIRQYPGGSGRAWALKYRRVQLGCRSYISKSCPAFIQLKLCPEKDKLIVTGINLHHNHKLPDMDVPLQIKRCKVMNPTRLLAKMANDISWKFLDPSDLKKLLGLRSAVFEERTHVLKELDSLFDSDPDVKVKLVFFQGKLLIKSIFLMTSNMQNIAQKFPRHLFVDFVSCFIPDYDFYTVFCEENGMGWQVCAYCFAKKGTIDTLRFIMVSIWQSIPTLKIQVKQIIVNPEMLDTLDPEVALPHASVRYCMPLVLDILYRKVAHLDATAKAQMKNILHILAHTRSQKVYSWYLNELKDAFPAEVFLYYHETWHPRRKLWMKKDNRTRAAESTIGASVHAMHQALLDQVASSPSLHRSLKVVLGVNKPVLTVTKPSQEFTSGPQMIPSVTQETDDATTSSEDEEKDEERLLPLPRSSRSQVSGEDAEERLERSEFHSWEDFRSFLDAWCLKKKIMFTIRSSLSLKDDQLSLDPQWLELAKSLKYRSVSMGCNASKTCPAVISLKLGPQKDKLILVKTMLRHNHDTLGANFPPLVTGSKLSSPPCLPTKITNDISRKFVERKDLRKLQRFHPAQFEDRTQVLSALDNLFISDPGAKVKLVFVENELLVKNIFIMTSPMQDMVQRFPEHLYVDLLPHFGSHVDLYTVYCEDDNSEWKECAKCIARQGTSANLRFLMVSMLQGIQNLTRQVKYVTVNPKIRDSLDLKPLVPFASLRYCMPLVLEILYERISSIDSTKQAQIKKCLHTLAHTCLPSVYGRYLSELKAVCPAQFFQYYYETWHSHRKMWIKKDNRSQIAESNICTLVKSEHQALRTQVDTSSSYYHCLQMVLNDSMKALNLTSSSHLQESLSELDTSPVVATHQACHSKNEEQLDQTEFSSWEDFCSFLDSWCEERMLLFRVRQSVTLTKEEVSRCPSGPVLAQCLKYSTVQLFCTRKGCPAFIKLQLCSQKEKLVVSNTSFQHNHDLPETDLSPPLKRSKLVSTVGLPIQLANNISRKFLGPNDLNMFQSYRCGAFEDQSQVLKELDTLFHFDPEAKVKLVFEEDMLLVKDIFLMTSSMQQIARCFPGYLYVDFFSGFSPGFDLYTVLCEEKNVGWKVCAYCIARKGTADNLKFIVVSIFQSIPILNSEVKYLTVSPEIQDPLDIEDLVPCASLRYCMPLVLELLFEKIAHINSAEEAQIMDFLHILAHTHSPTVYNQTLGNLKAACPVKAFQYYYETWHPCRKLWAEEFNSAPDAESSICAYVKSKHQILAAQMGISPSLHHCLQVVLDDSKTTLPITDSSQEYPSVPVVSPAVVQQKVGVPAASMDKEETEESPPERSEDSDISKGRVGKAIVEEQLEQIEFHSWEDFCSFLDNWCKERKLKFVIRHSVILTDDAISQDIRGPEASKLLKYSFVHMVCSVSTKRKNCPAFIKLRLGPQKDKLIVTNTILHHDHDLSETASTHEIKPWQMMAPIDLPTRIANDISWKFLEHNDLRRLQRFHSGDFEDRTQVLTELGSLFISDPGAKIKLVFVEDKRLVKNIFLMTSHMQDLAHRFAGHLYVDLLADFSPGFALYTIFCEEESMGWKVCAYCLARKDGSDSLRFLMVSVLQSIPKLNTSVKHLTVSPEIEDALDIEALVPYASVRYCMSLVLELLYSKLSHLDSIVQAQIKKHLLDLAHSVSPEIYSHSLTNLIAVCPADFFQYYYDTWHPRKKLWVREQGENQGAEDSICAFVKAKHLALKGRMGTSSSLHHCLQVVLCDSRTSLEDKTLPSHEACAGIDNTPTNSQQVGESAGELKGREFRSWTEFCEFFDSWCEERKVLYKIELATPANELAGPAQTEGLKYAFVKLVCQKTFADAPHPRTTLPSLNCPCSSSITLRAVQDRTRLSIIQAFLDHNHELDAWEFQALFSQFRLTSKFFLSAQLTSSISQRFLMPSDLQLLLDHQETLEPALVDLLWELEALLLLDSACQVRLIFQPNTVQVDSLFLVTSHNRALLRCYPSILYLGRSLAVNSNFDLYTVLCEDTANQSRECAYFITRKENQAPIRFLVAFFIQSVPAVRSLTKGIILQADLKELDLIHELLPSCCVRMSQTHALNALYKKLAMEDPSAQVKLKRLIYNMVRARSPVVYNFSFQKLEATAPPRFLHHFLEAWQGRKEDWAEYWGHRMRNGQFLEYAAWKPEELRSAVSFPSPLAACIQALLKVAGKMVQEEEKQTQLQPAAADERVSALPTSTFKPDPVVTTC